MSNCEYADLNRVLADDISLRTTPSGPAHSYVVPAGKPDVGQYIAVWLTRPRQSVTRRIMDMCVRRVIGLSQEKSLIRGAIGIDVMLLASVDGTSEPLRIVRVATVADAVSALMSCDDIFAGSLYRPDGQAAYHSNPVTGVTCIWYEDQNHIG